MLESLSWTRSPPWGTTSTFTSWDSCRWVGIVLHEEKKPGSTCLDLFFSFRTGSRHSVPVEDTLVYGCKKGYEFDDDDAISQTLIRLPCNSEDGTFVLPETWPRCIPSKMSAKNIISDMFLILHFFSREEDVGAIYLFHDTLSK